VQALGAPVDVLINNAGFGLRGPFLDAPLERLREMVDLNVRALTELTWLFARPMVERRQGHILLVASIAAAQPSPQYAVYAATKAYVDYLGMALHHELRGTGVSVTVTSPGPSPTEFGQVARQGPSLMHTFGELPSAEVVRLSLDALFARKPAIVPGWTNATMTALSSLMPRRLSVWLAERFTHSG
jgi:short-subunit dehydrogenase